jgi:hypothetical protein
MPSGQSPVEFTADISANANGTRVSGEYLDKWDGDEEIGIYMYKATLTDYQLNAHYRLAGADGKFSPANDTDLFLWPEWEPQFVAYYPYRPNLSATYPVNVADQTKNIDLMYAPGRVQSNGTVELTFAHQLSRLILSVTHSDPDAILEGIDTKITGLPATAGFDLAEATLSNHGNAATITAKLVSTSGNTARVEAIVLPGENLDYTVKFTLADGSVAQIPMKGKTLLGGKQYKYNVKLNKTNVAVASESIEGWYFDDITGPSKNYFD